MSRIFEGETFLITDSHGNLTGRLDGLYYNDTRHLSKMKLGIDLQELILLNTARRTPYKQVHYLTNPGMEIPSLAHTPRSQIKFERTQVVGKGKLSEKLRVTSYLSETVQIPFRYSFGADFKDIFELEGLYDLGTRKIKVKRTTKGLRFIYLGGVKRETRVIFSREPDRWHEDDPIFDMPIKPREPQVLFFTVTVGSQVKNPIDADFDKTLHTLKGSYEEWMNSSTRFSTDNLIFNRVIDQGQNDLRGLTINTNDGLFPLAGVPWFVAPFGRDSLITSYQMLSVNPDLAKGALRFLVRYQGKKLDKWREEEPGRIMHELRRGELAILNKIPHTPYYATIDATPLFLILLSETYRWTNDLRLVKDLMEPAKHAMRWIDEWGDRNGDGYVEYGYERGAVGLENKGWKDSWNSILYSDGSVAKGPIAVVEVQGYVYDAKRRMAELFNSLGEEEEADRLHREAEGLKKRFNRDFWMPSKNYFALALDGHGNKVDSITSNPGHCLWSGIVDESKAKKVADRLLSPELFSGWGIRTMSTLDGGYNPMSYHNGSVWPHDNSLIARGLIEYGFKEHVNRLYSAFFEASNMFEDRRLPELFAGSTREITESIVRYPVACSPQAWASGAIFLLLQSFLGIIPDAPKERLFVKPALPEWINHIDVRGLRIGQSKVNMTFGKEGFNAETVGDVVVVASWSKRS